MGERLNRLALNLLILSPFGALTQKQKEWVRRRDSDQCQAPATHDCGGEKDGHHHPIHHILGQRYLSQFGVDPDFPENVLEICQNFHDLIHPDVPEARKNYHSDKQSFDQMFKEREEKIKRRQIPWNSQHDRPMQVRAIRNTQQYKKEHPDDPFPPKERRKK